MKKWLLILCTILTNVSFGQSQANEFGFRTENDSYLGFGQDQYYTNGLFLTFRHAFKAKEGKKYLKRIWEGEVGQYMYNAHSGSTSNIGQVDRPFAAYTFVGVKFNSFKANENHLQLGVQVGTIGPNALGRQAQELLHNTFRFYKVNGWQFQVANEVGINSTLGYDNLLFRIRSTDLILNTYLNIGNTFSGAGVGLLFRSGSINPLFESIGMNARISNGHIKADRELFFFARPFINYVAYNATIQGGLFRKDKGPAVFIQNKWVLSQEVGAMYAKERISLCFSAVFKTKELKEQQESHEYGSLGVYYRF